MPGEMLNEANKAADKCQSRYRIQTKKKKDIQMSIITCSIVSFRHALFHYSIPLFLTQKAREWKKWRFVDENTHKKNPKT